MFNPHWCMFDHVCKHLLSMQVLWPLLNSPSLAMVHPRKWCATDGPSFKTMLPVAIVQLFWGASTSKLCVCAPIFSAHSIRSSFVCLEDLWSHLEALSDCSVTSCFKQVYLPFPKEVHNDHLNLRQHPAAEMTLENPLRPWQPALSKSKTKWANQDHNTRPRWKCCLNAAIGIKIPKFSKSWILMKCPWGSCLRAALLATTVRSNG